MRPCVLAITAAAVLWPSLAAAQAGWVRYSVVGSSAAADIPTAIFTEDAGPAPNGPGRRFATADGRADLTVQSVANPGGASPAAFLAAMRPPPGIIYRRVTPRFFAVSSVRHGRIWYNRCNRAAGAMNCVLINYPAGEKRRWDAVVTRISRSLSGG